MKTIADVLGVRTITAHDGQEITPLQQVERDARLATNGHRDVSSLIGALHQYRDAVRRFLLNGDRDALIKRARVAEENLPF
jgi:hypothetical protein